MPSLLLIDFLERSRTRYQLLEHRDCVCASDAARLLAIAPRQFAKVVMLRLDGELVMMVVPASHRVLTTALGESVDAPVEVAQPRHFLHRFPRCEPGAIPPFGHLFGLRAFGSELPDEFEIVFKAGTHRESVVMPIGEFRRLAHVEEIPGCAVTSARSRLPLVRPAFGRVAVAALPPQPLRQRQLIVPPVTFPRRSWEAG